MVDDISPSFSGLGGADLVSILKKSNLDIDISGKGKRAVYVGHDYNQYAIGPVDKGELVVSWFSGDSDSAEFKVKGMSFSNGLFNVSLDNGKKEVALIIYQKKDFVRESFKPFYELDLLEMKGK